MKVRDLIFLVVGGALAFCFCIAIYVAAQLFESPKPNVPTVAGQQVPKQRLSLNFTNRFDFHCDSSTSYQVFRDCKLIGFTGEATERSSGISSGYYYFDDWIVLEDRDGHRFYVRQNNIQYIEDVASSQKQSTDGQ